MLSLFSHVQFFVAPWNVAQQGPLSMGFSRQECWSGLPCPPPGDLPDPGIEPESLMVPALADRFFTTSTSWETLSLLFGILKHMWTSHRSETACKEETSLSLFYKCFQDDLLLEPTFGFVGCVCWSLPGTTVSILSVRNEQSGLWTLPPPHPPTPATSPTVMQFATWPDVDRWGSRCGCS